MSSPTLPPAAAGGLSRRRRFLVLAICCASVIAVVMDISIVNVALPAIGHDLHTPESGLQWTVDAYTLVLASFLVLAGSTADRAGRTGERPPGGARVADGPVREPCAGGNST